jgi:hypothetical protein
LLTNSLTQARAESFLAAADMAVKMGQPAAAVTEYDTLYYWVEDGSVLLTTCYLLLPTYTTYLLLATCYLLGGGRLSAIACRVVCLASCVVPLSFPAY